MADAPCRIYGYAASINVRKVLWTCDEIGVPYVREDWGGGFRSTSDPVFLSKNPVGMVPVIDDGGTIVWESNTIVRYLAASRDRTDLLPIEPRARAQVEQWMDWQASDLNNTWRHVFQALVRGNPAAGDPAAIAASIAQFTTAMQVIDRQLERTSAFITGSTFTAADIVIGLSIRRWYSTPFAKPDYANVRRYYEQLCTRPAFARHGRDGGP